MVSLKEKVKMPYNMSITVFVKQHVSCENSIIEPDVVDINFS